MKEELLIILRDELVKQKIKNEQYNKKVKRIRKLQKDAKVKEYMQLTDFSYDDLKLIKVTDSEIIDSFYRRHLYKIKENETNGLYVYLGTYQNSHEIDIVHGGNDIRVNYDSKKADYRIYQDIEQSFSEIIHISKCEQFEKDHTIINPKMYLGKNTFYDIQKEFFVRAVKVNQESAKKLVLKKYNKSK